MTTRLHLPAGTAAAAPYAVAVSPEIAGWGYSSLRVLELGAGQSHHLATGDEELLVLPLSGACRVECDGQVADLSGRPDVFSALSDLAYLPRDAEAVLTSEGGGSFALPGARCRRRLPFRYRAASAVPVELRGAGSCTRQVNNVCAADSFEADRLIAVEVLTPAGNWSSYPPHKHDEELPDQETVLEEVYYFQVRRAPAGAPPGGLTGGEPPRGQVREGPAPQPLGGLTGGEAPRGWGVTGGEAPRGLGFLRVYGTTERPVDVLAEVRDGDVVLVPHGWHGPAMAAPGYDLYYLNVMAGPGERAWRISDDPEHAWVRDTWAAEALDPRLPLTRPAASSPVLEEARS